MGFLSMIKYEDYYHEMPDGTIKQINPFTGTEVWCVPGRIHRPYTQHPHPPTDINKKNSGRHCPFCTDRLLETPPEKSRMIESNGKYKILDYVEFDRLFSTKPKFRRIPNLFEIVTFDYWRRNYGFKPKGRTLKWKEQYMDSDKGRQHAMELLKTKLLLSGKTEAEIASIPIVDSLMMLNAFFAGSHEVITAGSHFIKNARTDHELFSSGDMTPEEHFQYMRFTIHAMEEITKNNPHVRYVSVFQNWLKPAGASVDHLHKQLVGLDECGVSINREIALVRKKPDIYNVMAVNFAIDHGWIIGENDEAIALACFGHRYPTVAIYSKSRSSYPADLSTRELMGFSNLVHACHAAMSRHISCNEEWYYCPKEIACSMPLHVLIKWRTITTAGFEGGTHIYINPFSPGKICNLLTPALKTLLQQGKIALLRIGESRPSSRNCLNYLLG